MGFFKQIKKIHFPYIINFKVSNLIKKPTTYHFLYLFNKWCYNDIKMFILIITLPKNQYQLLIDKNMKI